MISPIVMLAIRDASLDMSPYVRKTAAHAIPKLYRYFVQLNPFSNHILGTCKFCTFSFIKVVPVFNSKPMAKNYILLMYFFFGNGCLCVKY